MLKELSIKNLALIDEAEIEFQEGLNILSGETGAGKSMIIDAINVTLGERADKDLIRKGRDIAKVSALFYISDDEVIQKIDEMGINVGKDRELLITRQISVAGKSSCKINGDTVTLSMLKKITQLFIDMHGQNEHQFLLYPAKHVMLLDKFCENELDSNLKSLSEVHKKYKELIKRLNEIISLSRNKDQRLEILQFQINEIKAAALVSGEEKHLQEKKLALSAYETIINSTNKVLENLYDGTVMPAIDKINSSVDLLNNLVAIDSSLKPYSERLSSAAAEIDDISRELRSYASQFDSNPHALEETEERLRLIYTLKRKYGGSVEKILEHFELISEEYNNLENEKVTIDEINKEKKELEVKISTYCTKLTEIRKNSAKKLEREISMALLDLGMEKAKFEIYFEKKDVVTITGWDKVEFMFSANPGEAIKPLSKIASGGEMSRVMLAVKSVMANAFNIQTFIFDEIDAGVSGRTAQKVAEKLNLISAQKQIICITHLPQIAAMADSHFQIEKISNSNDTKTVINKMDKISTINELARLIGGAKITEATLKAANEMKELAEKLKM